MEGGGGQEACICTCACTCSSRGSARTNGDFSGGERLATSNDRMFGSSGMFQRPRKFNQEPKYMSSGPKFGLRKVQCQVFL